MALPVNIDDLINHRKVEWARIEYKEGWNPEKVLHTLSELSATDPVSDPVEGVNEGVKLLLAVIRKNPGRRTNELALLIGKSGQTVERYVKELKGTGDIEFRGAPKNGGYFAIDNEGR